MSNILVNRLWAGDWAKTVTGDGVATADADGVLTISAGGGSNSALMQKAFTVRGGDVIQASVTGRMLSGAALFFVSLNAGGGSPLTFEMISENDMFTHTIRTAIPMSIGEATIYVGIGFSTSESGNGRFHSPRIIADAILAG